MDYIGNNSKITKMANRALILRILLEYGPISRVEIARIAKLTQATITKITQELLKEGIIVEVNDKTKEGESPANVGRRPVLLDLKSDSFYVIGIEISDRLKGGIFNPRAGLINKEYCALRNRDPLTIIQDTVNLIESLLQNSGVNAQRCLGIGVGVPGLVDCKRGLVKLCPRLDWANVPLATLLSQAIGLPVVIDNNVRTMTLGEKMFGKGRNSNNMVLVYVDQGIGAGIIIGKELYSGSTNGAGEVGHMVVVDNHDLKCSCGRFGCLETVSSWTALFFRARQAAQERDTILKELSKGKIENINLEIITQAASLGDEVTLEILTNAGRNLGIGISNVVNILNPDLIVLAGRVPLLGAPIIEPLTEILKQRIFAAPGEGIRLEVSELGVNLSVIGPAALALEKILIFPC